MPMWQCVRDIFWAGVHMCWGMAGNPISDSAYLEGVKPAITTWVGKTDNESGRAELQVAVTSKGQASKKRDLQKYRDWENAGSS